MSLRKNISKHIRFMRRNDMKLVSRENEVKQLLNHVLQDFLELDMKTGKHNETVWKKEFVHKAKNHDSRHASSYQGFLGLINSREDNYFDTSELDTTIISAIYHSGSSFFNCHPDIGTRMSLLNNDRCHVCHENGNETDIELLQWIVGTLHDIENFIDMVLMRTKKTRINNPSLNEDYNSFKRKHEQTIQFLLKESARDYDEAISIQAVTNYNLSLLTANPDNFSIRDLIMQTYIYTHNQEGLIHFLKAAAEHNFQFAYNWLGDYNFGIYPNYPANYKLAAKYYELANVDTLSPERKLRLASIYLNELTGPGSKSHGEQILNEVKKSMANNKNYTIKSYVTEEGYTFWYEVRKQK